MADPAIRKAFAEAALAIAAERGWRGVTLHDLAAAAGRTVADLHPLTPADAFEAVDDYFDRAAAEGALRPDAAASARDRVFDAVMCRFEAMEPHRSGVLALDRALERDPLAQAASLARIARTARWLLALAGEDSEGVGATARAQGLAIVLGQARAAWRQDEAGDFARTMAALDKGLRRAESFFESVERMTAAFRPAPAKAAPADEGSPEDHPAD
jgi:hypothetical protein